MISFATRINKGLMLTDRRKRARAVYLSLILVSLIWLGLIFAAPALMAERHSIAAIILYRSFSAICHQIPERSFYFCGFPLGVCSRCTGIYAGFMIGLLLYPVLRRVENENFPTRWWLAAAAVPAAIDFGGGYLGLLTNTFQSRAMSGFFLGAAAAFYIVPGFVSLYESRFTRKRDHAVDLKRQNPKLT